MIVLRKPHDISEKRKRWQLEDLAERERALDAQLSLHQSKALTSTERATERYLRMLHRNSEATVFACWKDESRASAKKRAQILRVGARIVQRHVSAGFTGWRDGVAEAKRRQVVLSRFSLRLRNSLVTRVMQTWCEFILAKKQQRLLLARCRARMTRRTENAMLARWVEFVDDRARARALVTRIVQRVMLGKLGNAFCVLLQVRPSFEGLGTKRREFSSSPMTCRLERMTNVCVAFLSPQLVHDAHMEHERMARDALELAARKAEQDIAERLLKRERAVAAIARLHGDALRSTLIAWRTHVKREKRLRKLTAEFALKWHRQVEVRSFAAWLDFVDERIHQRNLLRRVLGGKAHAMVLCAWRVWREDVADHALCLAKQRASAMDEIEAQLASESSSTASLVATLEVRRFVVRAPPRCARRPAFMTNQNHSERVLLQLWALLPRRNVPPRVRRHSATLLDSSRCGSMQLWCLVLRRGRSFWLTSVSSRLALARSYRR